MDLDRFFDLKSLRERLKRNFDDSKLFFHFERKFWFLISTRFSPYFDSLSAANMISDMVSSEILV